MFCCTGFGKFHYMLMLGMIPLCAAQLFSSGSIGLAMPSAECDLQLEDFQKGALNGATYLGEQTPGLSSACTACAWLHTQRLHLWSAMPRLNFLSASRQPHVRLGVGRRV